MWREGAIKLANATLPGLRVVGLVYVGLGGIAATKAKAELHAGNQAAIDAAKAAKAAKH